MSVKSHLKAFGLILGMMFLVTVVTAIVALRLRGGTTAATRATQPPAAITAAGGGVAKNAVSTASGAGTQKPAGGQCSSGASSLVEGQALPGNIRTGLGSLSIPTSTASAP